MFRAYRAAVWSVGALLAVLTLALVFTLGYVSNDGSERAGASGQQFDSEVDFDNLNEVIEILKRDYFDQGKIDEQQLYEAAVDAITSSLDDSGVYYIDPETYQLAIGFSGTFEGIGATVQKIDDQIVIVQPIENSPAQVAGVLAGDVILAVDGEATDGWTVDKTVLRIRGPKGSDVAIRIRHRDGQEEDLTITRDEIQVASVTEVPPGGSLRDASGAEVTDLAYIHIAKFAETTPGEVEALASAAQEQGKRGLIIDMRPNPGGLLQETVDVADLFLDEGTILTEVYRDGERREHSATTGGVLEIPIVVLVDEHSASGAEVLAAALRDNGRAIIVGEQTFGKGTVNIERGLEDGGALFVTVRQWLTPAGQLIDRVGVTPDIEVLPGPLDEGYDPAADAQLLRAIEQLRGAP